MKNSNALTRLALVAALAALALFTINLKPGNVRAQNNAPVQIVNGYPEFQFHGQPFFPHSAAFFYNRLPRDEWVPSLVKLKEMGVNTIDLYVAWNWHEPEEGKLDFDGKTNPRRDVKGLLAMLDAMGFAVIVRPGPVILNEWRNGGYPDWLLARPEYQMNEAARLDGHYPPLSGLSASNSEEASKQWLANETHLKYTRKWFGDVMRELLKDRLVTSGGGNVIALQLDDDQAINRANYNGPVFWQYMNTLAGYLREAGADVPLYINPTDMRVSAAGAPHNIGAMGQWYFNFGADPALRWEDSALLQFYTETLKTQPHFPPMIIEYQAGWYGTGEDTYAKTADPTNTLLSSRVLLGHGLRGLNYFPVQDTLYPAGYEVPWANHYYTWESALNVARQERPRAAAVQRNGRLLAGVGRELAAAHKVADVGLIYPISSFAQATLKREEVQAVSQATMQMQQYCQLNQITVEYLDLEFQPLAALQRHKVLLLPVIESAAGELSLSKAAQQKLVDYVKAGGRLLCSPGLPKGELFEQMANNPGVLTLPDWWREAPLEAGKKRRAEVIASVQTAAAKFLALLETCGARPSVQVKSLNETEQATSVEPHLLATQLAADSGDKRFALLNVVNFDEQKPLRFTLSAADTAQPGARLELPEITLRARDALLLPLRFPLGGAEAHELAAAQIAYRPTPPPISIYYATAELVQYETANGQVRLRFYSPEAATVALQLRENLKSGWRAVVDGEAVKGTLDDPTGTLLLKIPAAAPRLAKRGETPVGRREHEHEVLFIYDSTAPEVNVSASRLHPGEANQVTVEVNNRASARLQGKLYLLATRGLRTEAFHAEVDLRAGEDKRLNFSLPLPAQSPDGDQVKLRAVVIPAAPDASEKAGPAYFSPTVMADVQRRFAWQITPASQWPLRADTQLESKPPLIYPTNEKATEAKFALRVRNNTAQELALTRREFDGAPIPFKIKASQDASFTYTYQLASGVSSVLNQMDLTLSDGRTTETIKGYFVTLRKGEAVAFAFDLDRDGFDDYVLENEFLRLVVSPRAGARAFVLIDKRTGANVFTSVGGLRDKFVELDPADPTRNPRRKRGLYGAFNRPYAAVITERMGKRAVLKLSYDAPDVYPQGARIERAITLGGADEFFTVDYTITPKAADGVQAFWSANSFVLGDPQLKAQRYFTNAGEFQFEAGQTRAAEGWVAAPINETATFALLWRSNEAQAAEVEMKDFSSFVNVKFKPFAAANAHAYRLVYCLGAWTPERLRAERARILGE